LRIGRERVRENFDRDRPIEPRVAGFVHLAHPAGAEQGQDFVRAEAGAGRESQQSSFEDYTCEVAGLAAACASGSTTGRPSTRRAAKKRLRRLSTSASCHGAKPNAVELLAETKEEFVCQETHGRTRDEIHAETLQAVDKFLRARGFID
jgi:hypothetical protein